MNDYRNILIAVDGSKEAEYALRKSIEIAKHYEDSSLTIVNVIDTSSISDNEYTTMDILKKQSITLLNEYKSLAETNSVKEVKVLIKYGSPKTVIPDEFESLLNPDVIICGATGLKGAEQYFLGSVSEAIVRNAKCDVLVVRELL